MLILQALSLHSLELPHQVSAVKDNLDNYLSNEGFKKSNIFIFPIDMAADYAKFNRVYSLVVWLQVFNKFPHSKFLTNS